MEIHRRLAVTLTTVAFSCEFQVERFLFVFVSGSMPTDYELYYGFTRFAVELNELCSEMKDILPPTDARFRPDQRYVPALQHPLSSNTQQRTLVE